MSHHEANELSEIQGNSPEEILRRFKLYVKESENEIAKIHERAETNYKFVSGLNSQWDDDDRRRMNNAKIPALSMNEVHRAIEHVAGREQTARYEPRVVDRSDQNPALAEVGNEFIRQQRSRADAEDEESDAFRELCIAAYGWVDFTTDIRGRVPVEHVVQIPIYEMLWDPTCRRRNLKDREWHLRGKRIAYPKFIALFPEHKAEYDELKGQSESYLEWSGESVTESARVPWQGFTSGRFYDKKRADVFLVEGEWKDAESYWEVDLPAFVVRSLGETVLEDLSPFGVEERPKSTEASAAALGELLPTIQEGMAQRQQNLQGLAQQVEQLREQLPQMQQAMEPVAGPDGQPAPPDPQIQQAYDAAVKQMEQAAEQMQAVTAELELVPIELEKEVYEGLADAIGSAELRVFDLERDVYRWAFAMGKKVLDHGRRPENAFTKIPMAGFADKRMKETRFYSCVDISKDHQLWTNKFYSLMIEFVSRMAKGGWIIPKDVDRDDLAKQLSQMMPLVELENIDAIKPLPEIRMPPELTNMFEVARSAVSNQMGLNAAANYSGTDLRRVSGEALSSLQQSIQTVLAGLFAALRQFRKEEGRLFISKMITYYDRDDLVKIVGEERAAALPEHRQSWRQALELNFVVDEVETLPAERMRTFETLTQTALAQELRSTGELPTDIIIDLIEMPESTKQKWRDHLANMPPPPPPQE